MSSINQSDSSCIDDHILAVLCETNSPDGSETEAMVQLVTWALSQFQKLQNINTTLAVSNLLPVPLIYIAGHNWHFLLAQNIGDDELLLIGGNPLGDTRSASRILQLLAVIDRLAYWIKEEYLPWYKLIYCVYSQKTKSA